MDFKQKVQSMTAREIILAMVEALTRPPLIRIDMETYGEARRSWQNLFLKPICFGCAATNTICQIAGIKFTPANIEDRADAVGTNPLFLYEFEQAINSLRSGSIEGYNFHATRYNDPANSFATIDEKFAKTKLPTLNNDYTNEHLREYSRLAHLLPATLPKKELVEV